MKSKIEVLANLAIILIAALLAGVLIKNHLLARKPAATLNQTTETKNGLTSSPDLSSIDIDWRQNKQTVVLAISSTCYFCTDSAQFYKTLVQSKKNTRVVAVLPQSVEEGRSYLKKLGVSVDEVRQISLDIIGVRGTPTVLLVDSSGTVKNSWIGRLPPTREIEVLNSL